MSREIHRKTPDQLLRELQDEEASSRGHLKIFLGYASGVGKSFRMLDEARRRYERGQDVVIGAVQPAVSPEVQKLLDKLEIVPFREHGTGVAMDLDTILRRHPDVCVIDGLAFNNPPELGNATRWEDAQQLVSAGIKVIGSVNIQYIEELREQVESLTEKHVTETVPKAFIKSADEIEIVDAPTEEPIERSPEQRIHAERRRQQLSMLREMTLVLAAEVVDHQLNDYLERHGIQQSFGTQERILVYIAPRAKTDEMIETARRIAERFHGEFVVAYVRQARLSAAENMELERKLGIARSAGAHVEILEGADPVEALLDFAKLRGITQLFIGHAQGRRKWLWRDPINKLIRRSQGMDLRIFPQ